MFCRSLTEKDPTEFKYKNIRRVGFEIDWFSKVNGRTLLSGHVVFQSPKNFRCKSTFEKFLRENTTNIPATIVLLEEDHSVKNFGTIQNFFVRRENELYSNYVMFGKIKTKKKSFRVLRKKRFMIGVTDAILNDRGEHLYTKNLQIACTFRDKMQ